MEKRGPWTVKSTEVKYKNPWIEVHEDQVIQPDGKDGIYGFVVKHPGVSILALNDEGFAYLTKEFKYAVGRMSLESVSGAIDDGESAIAAAKRELQEEAGITADEWIDLGSVDPFTASVDSPAQLFIARKLHFGESHLEGTETLVIEKVKFEEAVQMVIDGRITHAQSCVLILKAHWYLQRDVAASAK